LEEVSPWLFFFSNSFLEPTTGFEPVNLFLTKEVLYLLSYVGDLCPCSVPDYNSYIATPETAPIDSLERETGVEPATLSLEG
jgi:hypothetical protein